MFGIEIEKDNCAVIQWVNNNEKEKWLIWNRDLTGLFASVSKDSNKVRCKQ